MGVLDSAGHVVFMNDDLAQLFGQDATDLIGQDIMRFVDEPQRPAARKALRQATRTGRVGAATWWMRSDGPTGRSRSRSNPRPLGRATMVTSSTSWWQRQRPNAHGSVQRQAMLASIAEECDEAIIGSGPGEVIEIWNHAAGELFGWEEKEALGAPDGHARPPGPRARGG